ncbi:predicted protein [Uncinocarpus reesii 1704]|uniref:Zn(2)-C6 fungal-type domain-containing protein n=1 Tax=Uncinocarpus reesii (strain UAMH 1704) TaxID=336963 RepID=C4JRH3_UNCRE|nr:uncharacterized protein UREG_05062 [Uncinocarpus reesii 1704]EEP80220.1 predicted protein [Uncinocarpus reesii 1704]
MPKNERNGGSLYRGTFQGDRTDASLDALRGAMVVFPSQAGKATAILNSGIQSKNAESTNEHKCHDVSQSTESVRSRVKQFSSGATGTLESPTVTPGNSTQMEYPQHIAAKLAVERSAVQTSLNRGTKLPTPMVTGIYESQRVKGHSSHSALHSTATHPNDQTTSLSTTRENIKLLSKETFTDAGLDVIGKPDTISSMDKNSPKGPPALPPRKKEAPRVPPKSATISADAARRLRLDSHRQPEILRRSTSKPTLLPQHTSRSESSLADAIAASSLASSRAASPSKMESKPPPPPPRRSQPRSNLLLQAPHADRNKSRTPSPSKGLKKTLRDETKSDSDAPRRKSPKRVTIDPRPYIFDKGNQKRRPDQITDKDRKTYEGVWAANKGIARFGLMDVPDIEERRIRKSVSFEDLVFNIVVDDIWSRSRLPRPKLEEIWNLVSHDALGMLSREEFVVGMWLIDLSLMGHKLPTKVPRTFARANFCSRTNMDADSKNELRLGKTPAGRGTRKKFTKPPVKVACLSCRASRIRCDGKDPCSSCTLKGKDCSYLPSRRGGPRKKKVIPAASVALESPDSKLWNVIQPIPRLDEGMRRCGRTFWPDRIDPTSNIELFNQVDTLAVPGAGLRALDFPVEVQSMFEGLFVPQSTTSYTPLAPETVPVHISPSAPTRVRVYGSEQDMSVAYTSSDTIPCEMCQSNVYCSLNGYYTFIHDYFPIFPPAPAPPCVEAPLDMPATPDMASDNPPLTYHPKSPVTLAISAILARVPHPTDPDPSSPESVLIRRSYSHKFALAALESVEGESELIESCASPAEALQNERAIPKRLPVHPNTPVELESILALLILSIYEYTQRGNLVKMRKRAGEAYVMAINMSLHSLGREDDVFAEARRRAWWMTGSIVSTTPPTILVTDPRFVTPLPHFAADTEAWSVLVQSQQVLTSATQYICDLNRALRSRADMSRIYEHIPDSSDVSPCVSPPASDASSGYSWVSEESFPFSSYDSTAVCLESALTIARMFDSLPYPNPFYGNGRFAGLRLSCDPMPRTMPSFACCAMQSSYAMLMLYYKSHVTRHDGKKSPLGNVDQLREKLRHGLQCVVGAVKNYAIAFEALDGMRGWHPFPHKPCPS